MEQLREIYKGYGITEVFHYSNGKGDFMVHNLDEDQANIHPSTTMEIIKAEIDEFEEKADHYRNMFDTKSDYFS